MKFRKQVPCAKAPRETRRRGKRASMITEYESCPEDVSFGSARTTCLVRPNLGMANRPRAWVVRDIIAVFMLENRLKD